jgi:putative ABC transport system permease protein
MHLVAGNRNWTTIVAGIADDYLVAREWPLAAGRLFSPDETEAGGKVAIIGADIVQQLFDGRSGLGGMVRIGNVPFTVIGVLDKKGLGPAGISQDDVVFIPLSAAESRVLGAVRGGSREALDFILVKVADLQAMPKIAEQITDLLRRRHKLRSDVVADFRIQDPADVLTARKSAMRTLGFLLMAIASVSLIVGGISIMNIMLVSVSERTREIGLRMAVGARRRNIAVQFLTEALTLALAGAGLGVLAGGAAAAAIALAAGWPVLISPAAVVIACGFAALVGVAFGVYPAYHASRLDPIVAFRRE